MNDRTGATARPSRLARTATPMAIMLLAIISCGQERSGDPGPDSDDGPAPDQEPVVGGPCSYQPLSFTVIVDSVLGNGDAILHPVDSVPWMAGFCPLREEGGGLWRANASVVQRTVPGDTAVIEGEVIETGTCTPCTIVLRPLRERLP